MTTFYQISLLLLQLIAGVATGISLLHFSSMLLIQKVKGQIAPITSGKPLRYIFMVPALNEELVIEASVRRLLSIRADAEVVVIDDGSTDHTAEIVESLRAEDSRVRLVRRVAPNARQGKGKALNYAYNRIAQECRDAGLDPESVIICVVDADGILDTHVLDETDGFFANPAIGAVQVGVRITNRQHILGRLQDIEFFIYTSVFQQGRNHIGSTGLGGNGQFARLSALISLGPAPWTKCLAEDLDLGLQLLLKGWKLAFTGKAFVHQQGLVDLKRLVRQRTRWVQGYFQCWRRIPDVITIKGSWYTAVDLLFTLLWPAVSCLVLPVAIVLSWFVFAWNVATIDLPVSTWVAMLVIGYLLAFGTSTALALHYRKHSGDMSLKETVKLVHCIGLFQFMWGLAGWRALSRIIRHEGAWEKTERLAVAPVKAS